MILFSPRFGVVEADLVVAVELRRVPVGRVRLGEVRDKRNSVRPDQPEIDPKIVRLTAVNDLKFEIVLS